MSACALLTDKPKPTDAVIDEGWRAISAGAVPMSASAPRSSARRASPPPTAGRSRERRGNPGGRWGRRFPAAGAGRERGRRWAAAGVRGIGHRACGRGGDRRSGGVGQLHPDRARWNDHHRLEKPGNRPGNQDLVADAGRRGARLRLEGRAHRRREARREAGRAVRRRVAGDFDELGRHAPRRRGRPRDADRRGRQDLGCGGGGMHDARRVRHA